ncbi:hypothetical protein ES703_56507 [subsurface metagenome]
MITNCQSLFSVFAIVHHLTFSLASRSHAAPYATNSRIKEHQADDSEKESSEK